MFSSVHSFSCVQLFVTPWTAPRQASLSITNSWSSLRLTSIESVMPSSHLILCFPLFLRDIHRIVLGLTLMTSSVQFSSVAQLCPTLCDPMNCSTPGLPVHDFTQTHIHRVSDAIQPSHSRLFPSPPAPNPSQHQSLFQ